MMKQRKKKDIFPAFPHQHHQQKKVKDEEAVRQDHLLWERVAKTIRPLNLKKTTSDKQENSRNNHFGTMVTLAQVNREFSEKCEEFFEQKNRQNKESEQSSDAKITPFTLEQQVRFLHHDRFSHHATLTKAKQQKTDVVLSSFNSTHTALPFMDSKSWKKISHGQLKIEAQLDLHGLDSARAHILLLDFISKAAWEGKKHVLIITGKGHSKTLPEKRKSGLNRNRCTTKNDMGYIERNEERDKTSSGGLLRQSVPLWLETAPFRLYISAIEEASRHHGGSGALYVRLRLPRRATS